MNKSVVTDSENDTIEVAREFASGLKPSDVVALYGNLGSGKTQFAKGICLARSLLFRRQSVVHDPE